MRLQLELAGDKQLDRELLRFADRATDVRPAWAAIMLRLAEAEKRQFDSEGQRASGGWAPLAASTLARKQRLGLDPRILHATGRLAASLTAPLPGGDAIREALPLEMRFGTDVPYAGFHQTGTSRMPQRRPLETTEQDRRDMFVRLLQRFLVTGEP